MKEAKHDAGGSYGMLLDQLTREGELEGCVLFTVKKAGEHVHLMLHKSAAKGSEKGIEKFCSLFSKAISDSFRQFRKEQAAMTVAEGGRNG